MSTIAAAVRSVNPGIPLSMFRLDTTSIGGSVYYFCQAAEASAGITYGGQLYAPVDVSFTGFEMTTQGGLPTPRVKIANTNGVFQNMVNTYGDLVGCKIQRIRTFAQYLDGQPQADPSAYFGPDMFRVERKSSENPVFIEWELSASIDNEGKLLPGRVVVRDTCLWRYRAWNATTNAFDYSRAQCPWTGGSFDASNTAQTNGALDVCSRNISGCKTRFGASNPLPIGSFPGVNRVNPNGGG